MDELLSDFITETTEALGDLDQALLKLERVPDDAATIAAVFRLMHTIKGTCGFLGLSRLEALSHAAEDLLDRMRNHVVIPTPSVISLVLAGVDGIKAIVAGIASKGVEPAGEDGSLIALLQSAVDSPAPGAAEPPAAGDRPASNPETPEPVAPATQPQTIRVNVDVIEGLMTLVSEMVLTRNQLLQIARAQQDSRFTAVLQRLSNLTSSLQEGVMRTRMQPIEQAWNRLPRMVRDLSLELGKSIELCMEGGGTELDRQVLEIIRDPLTHLVRNSADHGLETTAARRAAGKPDTGMIFLRAYHEGGHIVVQVGDDGRGLPVEAIRARAVTLGHATESEAAAMTERQVLDCIFRPGFSLAAAVTAVSGRGVGMDVVRTNIERIGGVVDLHSRAGQGVTFTITIPLTLAIISALIVEVEGERFALPQSAVIELVRIPRIDASPVPTPEVIRTRIGGETQQGLVDPQSAGGPLLERVNGTPVLRLRERLLPLIQLNSLLRLEPRPAADGDHHTVVVTAVGASIIGLSVDRVFDVEEIVAKPQARMLRHIPLFSGNTILGDGSVIMILDPAGIARAGGVAASAERKALGTPALPAFAATEAPTALLLFRSAADGPPVCVPLGLVARIEDVDASQIQGSSGRLVMQYRGRLMPLMDLNRTPASGSSPGASGRADGGGRIPVLVFIDRQRCMGLVVHEILDVIEERLSIEVSAAEEGLLGTAVIAGSVTAVLDAAYWLTRASRDWFEDGRRWQTAPRLLVVEDNAFFLHLLVPALSSAGYQVTAVDSAAQALALREQPGLHFDAIVSDIEMPDMNGLAFVRAVRAGGCWADLPMIALSGRHEPEDVRHSAAAGFSDHVGKFDRERLLQSLRTHLSSPTRAAA